ncbi:hypothetical protein JHK82_019384 [Glycine max]|nr:hypothetical protein JHK85_019826 [Glycine max]KAG5143689.1 hypothetical protein JHK82_019384 [Glycine max]
MLALGKSYDTSTPVSRNATIYCSTEILSLDWECKSDRLVCELIYHGTSDGCIKAWNVDAKRVVCDLNTTEAFPSVLDIKCSPVEPIFVSAAASGGAGSNYIDNLGFASLTVWNMKTWKAMSFLLEKIHQQLLLYALITMERFWQLLPLME